jgi:radical SAM superfamily enzyme YgiQ (UPF0313 family)
MKISLSSSLHLDHANLSLDQRPGDQPIMQSFVPVGLLSLKACLDRASLDAEVRVIELNGMINEGSIRNNESFYDQIVDVILDRDDDLVGLMTDSDSLTHSILLAKMVKERSPNTRICLGGPAASPIGSLLLERFPFVDYVVRGEGELTFVDLCRALLSHRSPADILGINWRDGSRVLTNPNRAVIENVNDLPMPAFDSYDMQSSAPLYLDVGRGCPFKCRFCATAPFWDRRYRMKTIDRIIEEMILVRDRFGRTHVNYSHDIFTCDARWTAEFCQRLAAANLAMTWSCSTRTDIIDALLLSLMAKAGCVEIYYGIETGSQATQATICKNLDLDVSREVVRTTAAVGIRPVTGFIVGHPTETRESLGDTLERFFEFLRIGGWRAHLFTLCPFHESPMFSLYKDTIRRRAQYFDIALAEPSATHIEELERTHRDIFASLYRYDSPLVPARLVDASEELSCHITVLRSIWPLLLPYYESALEWYTRWVEWIEAYNEGHRTESRLSAQGNAYDLIRFVKGELSRLNLDDSDLAELVRYEEAKLDARGLPSPRPLKVSQNALTPSTLLKRRCGYLALSFQYDLRSLLAGTRSNRLTEQHWVIVAKTENDLVDSLETNELAVEFLRLADRPISVEELLSDVEGVQKNGIRVLQQLRQRGLLYEVTA